ncbi:MAG: hypothetical protein JNG88_00055 [Phycisphaerales bacterium]|nr:hypothetical protein [Phycisphaerales bacterium]
MIESLPRRAFLRFEIPIFHWDRAPHIAPSIRKWNSRYMLPPLVEVEGEQPFADVYAAWSAEWFFVAFDVPNRRAPLRCSPETWWKGDGVRICIATRDTRETKRGNRFCHFFYVLPTGGGKKKKLPVIGTHKMSHAKETPPPVDVSQIRLAIDVAERGYSIEAAIPTTCLNGWDPTEHARIGFFYKVNDSELGAQHLTATDELGWNVDPSTWATVVLAK